MRVYLRCSAMVCSVPRISSISLFNATIPVPSGIVPAPAGGRRFSGRRDSNRSATFWSASTGVSAATRCLASSNCREKPPSYAGVVGVARRTGDTSSSAPVISNISFPTKLKIPPFGTRLLLRMIASATELRLHLLGGFFHAFDRRTF